MSIFVLPACAGDTHTGALDTASNRDASAANGGAAGNGDTVAKASGGVPAGGGSSGTTTSHDASATERDSKADASAVRETGSQVPFFDGDAGPTPPSYCVAPCVWDVVKHCIPSFPECVTESVQGLPATTKTCDPTTGWAEFSGSVGPRQVRFAVSRLGARCFAWDGNAVVFTFTLSDRDGKPIALKMSGGPVYCGATYPDLTAPGNTVTDAGIVYADGHVAQAYPVDLSRPECAAWNEYGLPVAPPCERVEAGTCQ